jgi:hypothetical protein
VEISELDFANRPGGQTLHRTWVHWPAGFSGIYSLAFKFDPVILFVARSIEAMECGRE